MPITTVPASPDAAALTQVLDSPLPPHVNGLAATLSPADVRGQLMTITPQMASDLFKRRSPNRPISKPRVRQMIDDMRAGTWQTNGEAIILDDELNVLDGQHRLLAVMESGVTIQAFVVVGVSPATMLSIDQGWRRTGTQLLHMSELPQAAQLASAARWLYRFERGTMRTRACGLRDVDLPAYVTARPSLPAALSVGRAIRDLAPQSVSAMLFHVMAQKDAPTAERYFEDLAHGSNLTPDDPAHVARERLLRDKSSRAHLHTVARAATVVLGWACLRQGKPMPGTGSWRGLSDPTVAFPSVV